MDAGPQYLTLIYDPDCEVCRRCRRWLMGQRQLVPISFMKSTGQEALSWASKDVPVGSELVVVSNSGSTWCGADAFLVCLWALSDYRALAGRLQRRGMSHLARGAFLALSHGRSWMSPLLGVTSDEPEDGACTGFGDRSNSACLATSEKE